MPKSVPPLLILASQSEARARMLMAAGISITTMPAHVDEGAVKSRMLVEEKSPHDIARRLAELKALHVSHLAPDSHVIGADQILDLKGHIFDKPGTRIAASHQLAQLAGHTHRLTSACAIARGGKVIWHHADQARLTMRPLTKEFIDAYLDAAGPSVLNCVGSYQVEGLGVQLFNRIDGDHFTIQGLDLLSLMAQLRVMGLVAA